MVLSPPVRQALRARLEQGSSLPILPDSATRVMATCQDEDADFEKLADLITHDQSLAAHLLRVANSAAFAPRVPILSLPQAIRRLGFATVANVAVSLALEERIFSVPGHEARIGHLWQRSLATAFYAREFAQLMRRDLDSAFLCGLLHDVGMPMILQTLCDLEREELVPPVSPALAEAAMDEFHCEFGARIAEAWRLGPWIGLVIRHHHDPAAVNYHPNELPVVTLADLLAGWTLDGGGEEDFHADPELLGALRMHEGALDSLLRKRERVLEALVAFS